MVLGHYSSGSASNVWSTPLAINLLLHLFSGNEGRPLLGRNGQNLYDRGSKKVRQAESIL